MQNIIKDSKIELNKIGKIKQYENQEIYYSKQKMKGKLFNIIIIWFLSLIYIFGETNSNESSISNSRKNTPMNSVNENNRGKLYGIYFRKSFYLLFFY